MGGMGSRWRWSSPPGPSYKDYVPSVFLDRIQNPVRTMYVADADKGGRKVAPPHRRHCPPRQNFCTIITAGVSGCEDRLTALSQRENGRAGRCPQAP